MYFAGWALTIIPIPYLADRFGRRKIIAISLFINILVILTLLLSHSLNLTICAMFFAGMITSGRLTVAFVYLNEFFMPNQRTLYGTLFILIDGLSYLVMTVYFRYIGNNYYQVCVLGLIIAIVTFCLFLKYGCESVLWQLKVE